MKKKKKTLKINTVEKILHVILIRVLSNYRLITENKVAPQSQERNL